MEEEPGERIEWTAPADLPGVVILLADNSARRWRLFHETYTVCTGLAISKPAGWRYRGKILYQPANGVSLMEPGEVHANTEITQPASFRVLLIDPRLMQRASEALGMSGAPHLKVAQLDGGPIHGAFLALHRALEGLSTRLERETRFDAALRVMLENCAESSKALLEAAPTSPAAWRARAYIYEHLAEEIRLEDLAAAAGSPSRFHLVRAFTSRFGLPPHAYQIHLRISRAMQLLAAGMRVADVAASLAFADQSHFTRHFRRITNVTPLHYAKSASGRKNVLSRVRPAA